MATIGFDSTSGLSSNGENSSSPHRLAVYSALVYTAGADEEIHEIGLHVGASAGDSSGVDLGIYDITGRTGVMDGATLVGQINTGQLSANTRNAFSCGPWALTEGNTYAVAWNIRSSTNVSLYRVSEGALRNANHASLTGTSAFADPWDGSAEDWYKKAIFATTQASAALTKKLKLLAHARRRNAA